VRAPNLIRSCPHLFDKALRGLDDHLADVGILARERRPSLAQADGVVDEQHLSQSCGEARIESLDVNELVRDVLRLVNAELQLAGVEVATTLATGG
jgi:hypothetical protein